MPTDSRMNGAAWHQHKKKCTLVELFLEYSSCYLWGGGGVCCQHWKNPRKLMNLVHGTVRTMSSVSQRTHTSRFLEKQSIRWIEHPGIYWGCTFGNLLKPPISRREISFQSFTEFFMRQQNLSTPYFHSEGHQ